MQATLTTNNIETLFSGVLESLSEKERIVIERRIGLSGSKETLQNIGNSFSPSITRERVRQIEDAGIKKVGRIIKATELSAIQDMAREIMSHHGGVLTREKLIGALVKNMSLSKEINAHILEVIVQSDFENRYLLVFTHIYSTTLSIKIVIKSIAACAIFVPGPKTPTAPASNR